MRRRYLAIPALLLGLAGGPAEAQKPAPDPERIAAARELMQVVGVEQQLDGMIEAMAGGIERGAAISGRPSEGKAMSAEFKAFMEHFKSYKQPMLDEFAVVYAERFSTDELRAVTVFYRSGPGSKFIQVMPELMQQGSAIGMKYAERVLRELQPESQRPRQ